MNLSDKTKVDEQSLHIETTQSENLVSQEGDKLLPQTEPKEEDGKQRLNSFNSNTRLTPHDETSESESEYSQNSSQSESLSKSFRNDDHIVDSPITVQNRTESDIDNTSLRNDNAIKPILVTVQNRSQPENLNNSFENDHSNDQNRRNESRPFIPLEKWLANCGPTVLPSYIKILVICFIAVVVLVITTVVITIAIVKQVGLYICHLFKSETPFLSNKRRQSDLHIFIFKIIENYEM